MGAGGLADFGGVIIAHTQPSHTGVGGSTAYPGVILSAPGFGVELPENYPEQCGAAAVVMCVARPRGESPWHPS
jgi:hypothetical protein